MVCGILARPVWVTILTVPFVLLLHTSGTSLTHALNALLPDVGIAGARIPLPHVLTKLRDDACPGQLSPASSEVASTSTASTTSLGGGGGGGGAKRGTGAVKLPAMGVGALRVALFDAVVSQHSMYRLETKTALADSAAARTSGLNNAVWHQMKPNLKP